MKFLDIMNKLDREMDEMLKINDTEEKLERALKEKAEKEKQQAEKLARVKEAKSKIDDILNGYDLFEDKGYKDIPTCYNFDYEDRRETNFGTKRDKVILTPRSVQMIEFISYLFLEDKPPKYINKKNPFTEYNGELDYKDKYKIDVFKRKIEIADMDAASMEKCILKIDFEGEKIEIETTVGRAYLALMGYPNYIIDKVIDTSINKKQENVVENGKGESNAELKEGATDNGQATQGISHSEEESSLKPVNPEKITLYTIKDAVKRALGIGER